MAPTPRVFRYRMRPNHAEKLFRLMNPQSDLKREFRGTPNQRRDAILDDLRHSGLIKTTSAHPRSRFSVRGKEYLLVSQIKVTRLGRGKILTNLIDRKAKFEKIGQRDPTNPTSGMKLRMRVANAFTVDLMIEMAHRRIENWEKKHGRKYPYGQIPAFTAEEVSRYMEKERFTKKDRLETRYFKMYKERGKSLDDLHPSSVRYQRNREALIDFAQAFTLNPADFGVVRKAFMAAWKEQASLNRRSSRE